MPNITLNTPGLDVPQTLNVEQARVIEAVSPTAEVERVEGGAKITVTDYRGSTTATVYDGEQGPQGETGPAGQDGAPGQDGVSPTIVSSEITGGHRLTITDAQGTTTVDVMNGTNGTNGQDGAPGADGFSPTASVSKSGGTATITITDKTGTTTAQVTDGTNGQDGAPGVGVPSGGTTGQVLKKASSTDYDTEWADLNPTVSVSGTTPSITALPGIRYICGECATLDVTLPASGCVDVTFESGSTPTVLTVTPPTGVTVKWANGFDPTSLDANTTYEINIADGLGVAGSWT